MFKLKKVKKARNRLEKITNTKKIEVITE
jgi:hypothetical protein